MTKDKLIERIEEQSYRLNGVIGRLLGVAATNSTAKEAMEIATDVGFELDNIMNDIICDGIEEDNG